MKRSLGSMSSAYVIYFLFILLSLDILVNGLPMEVSKELSKLSSINNGLDEFPDGQSSVQLPFPQLRKHKTLINQPVRKNLVNIDALPHVEADGEHPVINNSPSVVSKPQRMMEHKRPQVPSSVGSIEGEQIPVTMNSASSLASNVEDYGQQHISHMMPRPIHPPEKLGKESIIGQLESQITTATTNAIIPHQNAALVKELDESNEAANEHPRDMKLFEQNPVNKISVTNANPVPASLNLQVKSTASAKDLAVEEEKADRKLDSAEIGVLQESDPLKVVSKLNQAVSATTTAAASQNIGKVFEKINAQEAARTEGLATLTEFNEMDENKQKQHFNEKLHQISNQIDRHIGVSDWKPYGLNQETPVIKGSKDSSIDDIHPSTFTRTEEVKHQQSGMDGVALEYMLMAFSVVLILILLIWRRCWYTICTVCFPRSNTPESPKMSYKVGYRPLTNRS